MTRKIYAFLVLAIFAIFILPSLSPTYANFSIPTFGDFIVFLVFRFATSLYISLLVVKYFLRNRKNSWLVVNILVSVICATLFGLLTRDFVGFLTVLALLLVFVSLPFVLLDYLFRFGRTGKAIVAIIIIFLLIVSNTGLSFSIKSMIDDNVYKSSN